MVQYGGILLTILVDIDSTITNFSETLLYCLNDTYNTKYNYNDITSYDWFERKFTKPWLPTEYKFFWDDVKVNPASVSTIESWVKQGHQAYLVTASHFNDMLGYKIRKTLEPFNPELINERNVIIAQDKSVVRGTIMIDDCVDNLYRFDKIRICYAQPWNEDYPGYLRHDNWNKINEIIQLYYKCPW